jgi:hypothetical protein
LRDISFLLMAKPEKVLAIPLPFGNLGFEHGTDRGTPPPSLPVGEDESAFQFEALGEGRNETGVRTSVRQFIRSFVEQASSVTPHLK